MPVNGNLSYQSRKLQQLRTEHRDLDHSISELCQQHHADQLEIQSLKKRKLKLKDEIALLERQTA